MVSMLQRVTAEKVQKELRQDKGNFNFCTDPANHIHSKFEADYLQILLAIKVDLSKLELTQDIGGHLDDQ